MVVDGKIPCVAKSSYFFSDVHDILQDLNSERKRWELGHCGGLERMDVAGVRGGMSGVIPCEMIT